MSRSNKQKVSTQLYFGLLHGLLCCGLLMLHSVQQVIDFSFSQANRFMIDLDVCLNFSSGCI